MTKNYSLEELNGFFLVGSFGYFQLGTLFTANWQPVLTWCWEATTRDMFHSVG